jgi:hypothetical protein
MNVNVNDGKDIKKILIFKEDDMGSFLIRIASEYNTLPIYINQSIPISDILSREYIDVNVSSLMTQIDRDIENEDDFKTFLEKNDILNLYSCGQDKYKILNIFKFWLQKQIQNEFSNFKFEEEKKHLEKTFQIEFFDPIRFLNYELIDFNNAYKADVLKNNSVSVSQLKIYKTLEKESSIPSFPFIKESSTMEYKTNIKLSDHSLNNIFSQLKCSEHVPFVTSFEIIKIYQQFNQSIPQSWIDYIESYGKNEALFIRIFNQRDFTDFNEAFYTLCYLFEKDGIIKVGFVSIDHTLQIFPEILIERLRTSFSFTNLVVYEKFESEITGTTIFPNIKFDMAIMSELVMNNSLFSKFMAIDEHITATKTNGNFHFFIENTDHLCNILSKVTEVEKHDKLIKNSRKDLGEMFVRLRFKKCKSQQIIDTFISIFSKLLSNYSKARKDVIDFYKKYIEKFGLEDTKPIGIKTEFTLRDIAPDLFVVNHTRQCPPPLKIVDGEEIDEKEAEGVKPIVFPRTKEEGVQHFYSCRHNKDFSFVGVIENNLENQDVYKYIPCCFRKNPFQKKTSLTREYYKDEIVKKGEQQNVLTTNKFVNSHEIANLPDNILRLFSTISKDQTTQYFRQGVRDTKQSFLECIIESLNVDGFRDKKDTEKQQYITDQYQRMIDNPNISVSLQENPGETPSTLRSILENRENYMNPSKWIRLCEEMYDCKIFIFSRKRKGKDVSIVIPNHKFLHLSYSDQKPTMRVVFIYEHYGSEKVVFYPRCELIVRVTDDVDYNFLLKEAIPVQEFYDKFFQQYYYSNSKVKLVTKYNDIGKLGFKFDSQIIDNYGKLRGLYCKDEDIFMFTTPLPPLYLPLYQGDIYKRYNINHTLEFVQKYNLMIESQTIKTKTKVTEISFTVPNFLNILFTVKIEPSNTIIDSDQDMPTLVKNESYPSTSTKIVDIMKMKRLSELLTEYFIYAYSVWHYKNKDNIGDTIKLETLRSFIGNKFSRNTNVENGVIIRSDVDYKIVEQPRISCEILKNNGFMDSNGKFILKDNEILKRLIYSIRLRIFSDINSILTYHEKTEIYNFYSELKYYTTSRNQDIVLNNTNVFQKIDHTIYHDIQLSKHKYFMKNNKIHAGSTVLLIESDESDKISASWYQNRRIGTEWTDPTNSRVYIYESPLSIKKINKKDLTGEILVYKTVEDDENKQPVEIEHTLALCKL